MHDEHAPAFREIPRRGFARRLLPSGVAVIIVAGALSSAPRASGVPVAVTFVAAGSPWRYLDTGANLGTAWRATAFADATWKTGSAELGYGDGGEATVVGYGPSATNKYVTTYFRASFAVTDATAVQSAALPLRRDDGAAVYLNGVEVVRSNLPAGTIGSTTRATSNVEGSAESAYNAFTVPTSALVSGINVVAVEVHQQWSGSSDLSFDLSLAGVVETTPTTTTGPTTTGPTTSGPTTTTTVAATTSTPGAGGPVTLIGTGSPWRYLDDGSTPPAAWRGDGFDDLAWKQGPAELGYGDGGEATVVGYGPSATNKYVTTYFRRAFTVTDPARLSGLTVNVRRDDGAAVYVNGTEVARSNLPAGALTNTTRATTWNTSETTYFAYAVDASTLRAGNNLIAVEVHQADPTSSDVSFDLSLVATDSSVTTTTTVAPTTTTTTPPGPATGPLIAAGDIGNCNGGQMAKTGALLATLPGTFLALGDLAYPHGTATDFANCYDPYFGSARSRTSPAVGNHEYDTGTADAYFSYFGRRAGANGQGWYSYDVDGWHVVALNSNCPSIGGCGPTSAQYQWLAADLAASSTPCLAAYWHHPLRASELGYSPPTTMIATYELLTAEGADIVLNGHAHIYERFARMTANGVVSPAGPRAFVVGTGGTQLIGLGAPVAGSEVRNNTTHGLLRIDLTASGYTWAFVPVAGQTFTDSGTDTC